MASGDGRKKESFRPYIFVAIAAALFILLSVRLFQMQIVQGEQYRVKAESNRIRLVEIVPPRGVMRDRLGRLLLTNRSSFTCYGVPNEL